MFERLPPIFFPVARAVFCIPLISLSWVCIIEMMIWKASPSALTYMPLASVPNYKNNFVNCCAFSVTCSIQYQVPVLALWTVMQDYIVAVWKVVIDYNLRSIVTKLPTLVKSPALKLQTKLGSRYHRFSKYRAPFLSLQAHVHLPGEHQPHNFKLTSFSTIYINHCNWARYVGRR